MTTMSTLTSKQKIAGAQRTKEAAYWKQQLAGNWEKTGFPMLPGVSDTERADLSVECPDTVAALLDKISRGNDMALHVLLLSGVASLLRLYTGNEDILIGQPILQQKSAEGELLNAKLVIRSFIDESTVFKDLLMNMRQTVIAAIEHQNYPLDVLAEELGLKSPSWESPFYDVGVELRNIHDHTFAETEPYKMLFSFAKTGAALDLTVRYQTRFHQAESVQHVVRHLFALFEQALTNLDTQISDIHLLTAEDVRWIQAQNATEAAFNEDLKIIDVFENAVTQSPDKLAIIGDGVSLTYGELNEKANRLARMLREQGVGPEQIVGVMAERSAEMMIGIVGILKAGGAYLPIDPNYPQARISYLLEDSRTQIVLTQSKFLHLIDGNARAIDLAAASSYADNGEDLERVGTSRDLAYVIYTSGSTGNPKGAMIEHRSVINRINWMQNACPISSEDVILQKTPISFDVSVWELFWWMFEGATMCLLKPRGERDPEAVIEAIEKHGITTMHFVPSMLNVFLDFLASSGETARVARLRQVFASGEALGVHQANRFNEMLSGQGARLINLYGPTEATVDVTHYPCTAGVVHERTIPIGKPIENIRIYIVDEKMRSQPVGVAGELCIAGVGLARGYLYREELTREKFVPEPFAGEERIYRTGDLARWLPNGNVEYLGRIDHQVKIRGYRIELGELEESLRKQPEIKEAVVIARDGSDGQKYLCGYVIAEQAIGEEALKDRLRATLPEFMVPSRIVFLEQFPLSPNGKLDRKALPAPAVAAAATEYIAPRNEQEQALADIWAEVLGLDRVSVLDDFFTLGGNSIHFISVLSKARKRGLSFTFQQFFQHPTIDQLLRKLAEDGGGGEEAKQQFAPFELLQAEDKAKLPPGLDDAYPMSMLQQGLIFESSIAQGSAMYHDILGYLIQGPFHQDLFEQAVAILVRQNPMFRTTYHLTGYSEPIQMVHKDVANPLYVVDLRNWSEYKQDEWYSEFIKREQAYKFNWEKPGLIRFHVQILRDDLYRYNISFHDSALDGWSINLVHTKLFEIYFTLVNGEAYTKAPVDNHFRNFVGLERAALASDEDRKFWENVMADSQFTAVPRWKAQIEQERADVCIHEVPLPEGLSDKIIQLAGKLAVPVKNVLMAAHIRVLSALSGSRDVMTGYEHSGRPELEEADRAIGLFLNSLPFRVQLPDGSWEQLIRRVYETEIQLLPHRRYPMAKIKQDLNTQNLLFETVFNFTYFYVLKELKKHKEFSLLDVTAQAETEFVLRAEYSQHFFNDEVRFSLHYHTNVFDQEQIDLIAGYYVQAMVLMVSDSSAPHHMQTLIDEQERTLQLANFNSNTVDYPADKCFHELFETQVARTPQAIAAIFEGESWTYDLLNRKANRLARVLRDQGVTKGSVVAVITERNLDWMAAVLGVFKSGAVYLPLEPDYAQERISNVIEQSGCRYVLTELDSLQHVQTALSARNEVQVLTVGSLYDLTDAEDNLNLEIKPEDMSYIIFTSGSTGLPKGAMLEHSGMLNHLYAKVNDMQMNEQDVLVQNASQCFDISVWQLLAAPLAGGTTLILSKSTALNVDQFIAQVVGGRVTILEVVPSYLEIVLSYLEEHATPFAHLRYLLVTGEMVKKSLIERWFALYPQIPVINAYGPTEASDDITHHIMDGVPERELVPLGKPIQNLNLYVLDEHMNPVPLGAMGEIAVSGVGVGRGYINNPEKTKEAFMLDPFADEPVRLYKTGDYGRWLPDGTIEYLGRKDDQVKIRGFRIEIGEIESNIMKLAGVQNAAVIIKQEKNLSKSLVAFYTASLEITGDQVREFLIERLPDYMVPFYCEQIDELPITPNGKTDKKLLTSYAESLERSAVTRTAPSSEWERKIAGYWSDVLNLPVEEIGCEDNFFALGGNSLMAMKIAIISDGRVSLVDLMRYPTLGHLAKVLEDGADREEQLLIDLTQNAGPNAQFSVVCVPYAAGNAINFQPLSEELVKINPNVSVYAIELPGHNLAQMERSLYEVEETAKMVVREILEKINTPIALWGHCSGTALALEVARLLEEQGIEVRQVFLAGRLMRDAAWLREAIVEAETMTNDDIKVWMVEETGYTEFEQLSKEHADFIAETFRHDTKASSQYFLEAHERWADVKLSCPVQKVASTDDKLTKNYEALYSNWKLFADQVSLAVIEQGGHYFIQSKAREAAQLILNTLQQESDR